MLFNSYEFIFLFLPITLVIYFYLNYKKLISTAKAFLVFSSLFFYSWWNINYLPLILISILFNYSIGNILSKKNHNFIKFNRKIILTIGLVFNISLLGYFKYTDFFIENLNFIANTNINLLYLLLPLAISFFTFQQIAYLIDSYKYKTKEYDFLNYTLFVTFFPQLIAGPIVHHKDMMPQFLKIKNTLVNYNNIALGLFIFSIGLFKKVVIADTFSIWATNGFDIATKLSLLEAWATSLSYTFQIYFDFSGYTDMAIGVALLFNIKLSINFNSPYKALNIQDFWRRWHITLSTFLRDYIYIPLGGSRKGNLRVYINLMITFIIGGFWHGAGWTFLLWGLLHGVALSMHRIWLSFNFRLYNWLAWLITFNFINITWVFFRAKESSDAFKVLNSMFFGDIIFPEKLLPFLFFLEKYNVEFGSWAKNINGSNWIIIYICICFLIVLFFKNSMDISKIFKLNYYYLLLNIVLLFSAITMLNKVSEFLYFNF